MLELWISIICKTDIWIALIEEWISIKCLARVIGPLCGEFTGDQWIPSRRPVTRSFDVFFALRLNKRLSKQSSNLGRHRAHYDITVRHIFRVTKISFSRISFLWSSKQILRMHWQHICRYRVSYLSYAIIVVTGWQKSAPARFESEQNELLKEFKFWWNDHHENGSLARMYFSRLLQFLQVLTLIIAPKRGKTFLHTDDTRSFQLNLSSIDEVDEVTLAINPQSIQL